MKCQGLYLGSPCKDSWFEVDRWVIKIMNALGVAVPLALGENQWRCSKLVYKCTLLGQPRSWHGFVGQQMFEGFQRVLPN
jgi:hypothetical protein